MSAGDKESDDLMLWGTRVPDAATPGDVRYWYDAVFDRVRRGVVKSVDAAGLTSLFEAETVCQFFVPAARLRADRDRAAGAAQRAACLRLVRALRDSGGPADRHAAALLSMLVAEAHAGDHTARQLETALDGVRAALAACSTALARHSQECRLLALADPAWLAK